MTPASVTAPLAGGGRLVAGPARGAGDAVAVGRCADGRDLVLERAPAQELPAIPLTTFVRELLAPLPAAERNRISDALARAGNGGGMSRSLHELRRAIRERLPAYERGTAGPRGAAIETVFALDERAFYIEGWALDREAPITRLAAVSPEGERAELSARAFRFALPHVAAHFGLDAAQERPGFLSYVELEGPSVLDDGWLVEVESAGGECLEAAGPPVLRDRAAARERVLADPLRARVPDDELMERHVRPAIERLRRQADAAVQVRRTAQFGDPPAAPDVTIVITLYGRIDLIEEQLAQFVLDPYVAAQDILYVLDSPRDEETLLEAAARLYPVYEVPFRVAVLAHNVGFANANNAGAELARAALLLLLNSDVLPDRPGWLERMVAFYEAQEGIGALGPKLLYEDGSIQHAGIHFHRPEGQPVWQDAHYYKGLHREFPAANVARAVPVVSGACMLIARDRYQALGGLHGGYVQGDYEDADLCLRLMEAGLHNWYFPEAELYHLEALSYSPTLRTPANRYNAWLHTRAWGDRIVQLEAVSGSR